MEQSKLLEKLDGLELEEFGYPRTISFSFDQLNKIFSDSEADVFTSYKAKDMVPPEEEHYAIRGESLFSARVGSGTEGALPKKFGGIKKEKITYPKKSKFIEYLTELLNKEYQNVQIQSIKRQEQTRIPISIITFTYEPGPKIGHIYVKDYKGKEDIRNKDIMIPIFLSELGLPTAKVIGYDYTKGEFTNRFAFLKEPHLDNVGQNVYTSVIADLNAKMLVNCSESIIELMVMMQINATNNLEKLKKDFRLELEKTDSGKLINERLLNYLDTDEENLKKDFEKTYLKLDSLQSTFEKCFCHGDFTPNNIIMGRTLNEYFFIDWELSRKDANTAEDLAMFAATTLGARQEDREDIADLVKGSYISSYIKNFNKFSEKKIDEKIFKDDFMVEELKAQLYKIGDQIWTQERSGESDARKFKSQWYLIRFLDIINNKKNPILKELKTKTLNLLREAKNVDYLKAIIKTRS